jgi:hypothetical protein
MEHLDITLILGCLMDPMRSLGRFLMDLITLTLALHLKIVKLS